MKQAIFIISVASALLLGGCNTVKGMGQDIERAGSAIEKAAQ